MTVDKINQIVGSLNKAAENSQKLAIPLLLVKLNKFAKAYPGDQTIATMSNIIDKLSNKQFFITRAELKNLYHTLHSRNTKFAELFVDELGVTNDYLSPPKLYERDNGAELDTSGFADPVLASALESAFDKNVSLKSYSKDAATKAVFSVSTTLDAWNLKAAHVDVVEGNDKFLVVKAEYHTPKGATSFYIPVEVKLNKIAEPELFMGNTGPQELNHLNIKKYLTSFAGDKLKINPAEMLTVLASAMDGNRAVTDAELAVIRLNSNKRANDSFFTNQVTGQEIDAPATPDVNSPPRTTESFSFEDKFSTPVGLASVNFGTDKVKLGNDLIARHLNSFGYKNHRITVANSDNNAIFYGVSLDSGKVAFTVPVKVVANKMSEPSVLLCDGVVSSFSADTINKLYMENTSDVKVAAFTSAQYGLKPSELITNIRDAVKDNNFVKAEDALNILKQASDVKAYAIGFKVYSSALAGNLPTPREESKCLQIIKSANNQSPVCAHTGLPVNKVYQDKEGNCRPLYRQGMDESYEGAYFMNHKIFG